MTYSYRRVDLRRGPVRSFGQNLVQFVGNARAYPGEGPFTAEEIARISADSDEYGRSIMYHYTVPDAFYGICKSRALWATNTFYLNDTEETRYVANLYIDSVMHLSTDESVKQKLVFWLSNYFTERAPANIYVCCFSRSVDALSQWRGYASKGGLCLGFDKRRFAKICDDRILLLRDVIYEPATQLPIVMDEVKKVVDLLPPIPQSRAELGQHAAAAFGTLDSLLYPDFEKLSAYLKHPAFHEENETRLIVIDRGREQKFRVRGGQVIPYVELDLRDYVDSSDILLEQLWFGPSREDFQNKQHSYEQFMRSTGVSCRTWHWSGVPYQEV